MSKLTDLAKSEILHLAENEGLPSLFLLITKLIGNMERDVLNMDLNEKSFAHLAIQKAKLDGAKLLEARLKAEIANLKGDKKHGRQQ